VDVICGEQDNQTTILKTCENLNVRVVGFYVDGHEMAPKCWICGANLNWGPFYVKIVKSVLDHSWKPAVCMPGIESDSARLSEFGKAVPEPVRKEVLAKETLLKQGKFDIFKGPLKDTEGRLRIPAGRNPDLKQLAEMDWLVDGVQAPTPKK
jgi:basic membrane protein A